MSGLSAAEELRMMELELAILQKKREIAAGCKGSDLSRSSTPDDGSSLAAAPPPPPPPMPPSGSAMSPTKWVIVEDEPGVKRWKQSSGNVDGHSGSTTPDDAISGSPTPDDGRPSTQKPSDTADNEAWGAEMQADVCGDCKLHPTKGKTDKTYKAKQERPEKPAGEKIPLSCCACKDVVQHCSQLLLLHEGEGNVETWAGGHWGHCFLCSRFNKTEWQDDKEEAAARKKFTNAAKRSWLATTKHYKEVAVRARTDTWSAFQTRLNMVFSQIL